MFIRYNFMGQELIDWNPVEMTGYEPKTTYYSDFSIAEPFGIDAIKETYENAMKYWKDNVEYMTEISMVLNWKTWQHHESNPELCQLYTDMFYNHRDWCFEHFTGDDLDYYIRTTD